MNPQDTALRAALTDAAEAWQRFVAAREAMNAAVPDVLNGTPAERALYDERYAADHEAQREHYRTALALARHAAAISASLAQAPGGEGEHRGFQAAVSAIRSWAAGFYNAEMQQRLMAVASDLEANRDTILGKAPAPDAGQVEAVLGGIAALYAKATRAPLRAVGGYLGTRVNGMTIFHLEEIGQANMNAPFQAVPFARPADAEFIAALWNAWPAIAAILTHLSASPARAEGALAAIASERSRQIEQEGWAPEHDDEHSNGELSAAALSYVQSAMGEIGKPSFKLTDPPAFWPWDAAWWKPTGARRDLVKAGALIAAEIERLDRAAPPPTAPDAGMETPAD